MVDTQTQERQEVLATVSLNSGPSEVSLLEIATILLSRKKMIGSVTVAAGVAAAAVTFLISPSFRAEAIILPPQQQQSALSALSGSLGSLAASSMGAQLGLKNPGDLYIGILQSRTIADRIIKRFDLAAEYDTDRPSDTRKALAKHASFEAGKDSLIRIAVEDHDPKRAADLANAYVEELYGQNTRLALTDAAQRRMFFEQQLGKEKDALANSEIDLKQAQQQSGLLSPAGQTEALIHSGAQLRAEITSHEMALRAAEAYGTDQNPQVQVLKSELGVLRDQLSILEAKSGPSGLDVSAGRMPQAALDYIRKMREVKYHETLYELLARQYEAARIDEAKQAPFIQVVDAAVRPDRKSSPQRLTISLAAAAAALVLSCLWTFFSHGWRRLAESPDHSAALQALNAALR